MSAGQRLGRSYRQVDLHSVHPARAAKVSHESVRQDGLGAVVGWVVTIRIESKCVKARFGSARSAGGTVFIKLKNNNITRRDLSNQHDREVAPQHAVADGRRSDLPKGDRGHDQYQSCRGEDGDGCVGSRVGVE